MKKGKAKLIHHQASEHIYDDVFVPPDERNDVLAIDQQDYLHNIKV